MATLFYKGDKISNEYFFEFIIKIVKTSSVHPMSETCDSALPWIQIPDSRIKVGCQTQTLEI